MLVTDSSVIRRIRAAAIDKRAVGGLTHAFYRYPARFSPTFVGAAIEAFSRPGDVVLDPYMGGGTTVVEAFVRGRVAIGCDLNSLAVFVTRAKVTTLTPAEISHVLAWSTQVIPCLSYRGVSDELADLVCPKRTKNLSLPRARPAKKLLALALLSIKDFPSIASQDFARAVLLNVAQWALNNRRNAPTLTQIRERVKQTCGDMLRGIEELRKIVCQTSVAAPTLIHGRAEHLSVQAPFDCGTKAQLVLTSPPYPGIHLLYHRWQVDGRRETAAPYWIADCHDGKGSAFYNFAGRQEKHIDEYFEQSLLTLRSIRGVMAFGGTIIQMLAFSNPARQLPRYLRNMHLSGFEEIRKTSDQSSFRRIWRTVPSRAWYAAQKGGTNSSREIVLIHRAI